MQQASTPQVQAAGDAGQSAPASPETQKAQQQEAQRLMRKVVVNGKEQEVDIDQIARDYQKYMSGNEKLQEAARLEKNRHAWLEDVKKNPWKVFDELGLEADKLAEQRLLKKIELEMMSPEQKEAYEARRDAEKARREAEDAREEAKKYKDSIDQGEFSQLKLKYATEVDSAIGDYYKKNGKQATPERLVDAFLHIIAHAETHGEVKDFDEVLDNFESKFSANVERIVRSYSVEDLVKALSPQQISALRQHGIEELRNANPLRQTRTVSTETTAKSTKAQRQNTDGFFKKLDNKYL